ncbi:YigZ family protein [Microtetraspora sp. NBRC 13810]|uniref:IMPACT family protein n=1 Tax=Microtetraspora sp. NBRC 13810 TaxID=3030990 RepID=UPI00249FC37B|nr:YigZ family protein [Microtetraspora sp. NBRC 13810]GLW06530.1 YigZ family protein [Microtetraspora sp. NBRC 13810]
MAGSYLTFDTHGTDVEHELEVRRSRFLCAIRRVGTEEEARAFVEGRRRLAPDATHHCSAYVLGGDRRVQRGDDDGEPGGTAGTPMLETLTRRGFSDVAAVVTRHFGGVLLGAGGLVRAYGRSVGETLDLAAETGAVVRMVPARLMAVAIGHAHAGRLENDMRASPYEVREVGYGADVTVRAAVGEEELGRFREWVATVTAGRARVEPGDTVFVPDRAT